VNVYTKVAQATIRLIAFALILTGFLLNIGYLFDFLSPIQMNGTDYFVIHVHKSAGWLILRVLPFLIGLILFWKSRALAERFTKDLD